MISNKIFDTHSHQWFLFGRDNSKPERIIDTNQYLIKTRSNALLMDPGGIELFAPMLASLVKELPLEQITHIFASHQDPDIISSLGLWDKTVPDATLYSPKIWEGFLRHFGMEHIRFKGIADQGESIVIDGLQLDFIPAHYLHSSGNFNVYDAQAKILMSGDIGAALENVDAPIFVEDFDHHIQFMEGFHKRWMPSNRAKNDWIARVRQLDIDMMCPQHGRIFKGDDVKRFLDWFEALEVGSACHQIAI
uniref:MBL fold metallo-hydrolase n=1 Tax=Ningiella ruwaisensis TaxID=2364274 RepID=UPI0010A04B98|nr:MBL fold metallo-hydrolase [Ningiella ruwaisensis]